MEWKMVFIEDDMSGNESPSMRIEALVPFVGVAVSQEHTPGCVEL